MVGLLSASPLGVSGPAAGLAVIVLTAITELGSFEAFLTAVVLAGALQIARGCARAGVLGYFIPSSVIKGMLAGIGIMIILEQLPHLVGHDANPVGAMRLLQADGSTTLSALSGMWSFIDRGAVLIGAASLALLPGWDRWIKPRMRFLQPVPAPLAAVVCGIAFQMGCARFAPGLALDTSQLVSVPVAESWSGLIKLFTQPDWAALCEPAVYMTAATLAVVASIETLLRV